MYFLLCVRTPVRISVWGISVLNYAHVQASQTVSSQYIDFKRKLLQIHVNLIFKMHLFLVNSFSVKHKFVKRSVTYVFTKI